jgi:hypothetical protein
MSRRSRIAEAAEQWLRQHGGAEPVSTNDFWQGLCAAHPDLTTPVEGRKTPRWSCMRDLRSDPAFVVQRGKISLAKK